MNITIYVFIDISLRGVGAVVAVEMAVFMIDELEIAPRRSVSKELRDESSPVLNADAEIAAVDVVEVVVRVDGGEVHFEIVDFETDIGEDPSGLDGREIDAEDGGFWKGIAHVESPDSGAGTTVEDALGGGDGGAEEFVVKMEEVHVVL